MCSIPVSISRDNIVDLEFLGDFLDAQVQGVGLQLLARHIRDDGGREAHQAGGLVLGRFTPAVALLAALGTILRSFGAAAALDVAIIAVDGPVSVSVSVSVGDG